MAYYKDLREYISVLDENNKLVRINREINKDTELHPLVRWQFRGLPESQRKAFLFENVTDVKGKKYGTPVLVAAHAASREVYGLAIKCKPDEIIDKWANARVNPIEPRMVESGPIHEEIHMGDSLLEHGGLDEFPVPNSTPGFDNAPYLTTPCWVTKDPDTGIRNLGIYRGMIKSQTRVGAECYLPQHMRMHREKCREKGMQGMPAAIVLGATPNISLISASKVPYGVDEYSVAGGVAGAPVELVKCKTVDLEVPATAEIVIEGIISTEFLERDGPFGEYTGYMSVGIPTMYMDVTCITHRKKPVLNCFISQFPPSESSTIRGEGFSASYYKFLKHDLGCHNVVDVAFHKNSGAKAWVSISVKKPKRDEVWRILNAAAAFDATSGKIIVLVDDDIDPHDIESVVWAMCFRIQPLNDIRFTPGKSQSLDPSAAPPEELMAGKGLRPTSAVMIDATMKWNYPPVSLPKKEFMDRAKKIWEEEGLPALNPKTPWYGYSLGHWTEEDIEEAKLALEGEHYQTGEKLDSQRIKG
ncbi:UbiD family decarboxylase [Chloroflexota bacterium]